MPSPLPGPPVMPKALQIESLKKIFRRLNPEVGVDVIDWEMEVDATLTLPENRLDLSLKFPGYRWFESAEEERGVRKETIGELEEYLSYLLTVVPAEARADFEKIFGDYVKRVRSAVERKLKVAPLKREIERLRAEIERVKAGVAPPPRVPVGVALTPRLEKRLRDVFEAALTRARVRPERFRAEFRLELESIKLLPTEDEMVRAIEELADDIIRREARPPRRAPVRPPPVIMVEVPAPVIAPMVEVALPRRPLSLLKFPRHPSSEEIELLWEYIRSRVGLLLRATEFDYVFQRMFRNWDEILKQADRLVDELLTGKIVFRAPPPVPPPEVLKAWGTFEMSVERLLWQGYSPMGAVEEAMKDWPEKSEEEIKREVAKAMKKVLHATDRDISEKLGI